MTFLWVLLGVVVVGGALEYIRVARLLGKTRSRLGSSSSSASGGGGGPPEEAVVGGLVVILILGLGLVIFLPVILGRRMSAATDGSKYDCGFSGAKTCFSSTFSTLFLGLLFGLFLLFSLSKLNSEVSPISGWNTVEKSEATDEDVVESNFLANGGLGVIRFRLLYLPDPLLLPPPPRLKPQFLTLVVSLVICGVVAVSGGTEVAVSLYQSFDFLSESKTNQSS